MAESTNILHTEHWKTMKLKYGDSFRHKYALSNLGRAMSFKENYDDGKLLSGSNVHGYTVFNMKTVDGYRSFYLHREVAKLFLPRPGRNCRYVIHLDHDKQNNAAANLRWATKSEVEEHQQGSPAKRAYKARQKNKQVGLKLDADRVKAIKLLLLNPGRKSIAQIAESFGISVMQVYRIRTGECWSHIKVR